MSKVTKLEVDGVMYDVAHLTADTQAEIIKVLPRGNAESILEKYGAKKIN